MAAENTTKHYNHPILQETSLSVPILILTCVLELFHFQ